MASSNSPRRWDLKGTVVPSSAQSISPPWMPRSGICQPFLPSPGGTAYPSVNHTFSPNHSHFQSPPQATLGSNFGRGRLVPGIQNVPALGSPYLGSPVSDGSSIASATLCYQPTPPSISDSDLSDLTTSPYATPAASRFGSRVNGTPIRPNRVLFPCRGQPRKRPRRTATNVKHQHLCRPFSECLGGEACHSSFQDERTLRRHLETVHGTDEYSCNCTYHTARKDNYIRHLDHCFEVCDRLYRCVCGETSVQKNLHESHLGRCRFRPQGVWKALAKAGAPSWRSDEASLVVRSSMVTALIRLHSAAEECSSGT